MNSLLRKPLLQMNLLYYGDYLDISRQHVPDESVDLIYLDPPFNSKAADNVLFAEKKGTASAAQVKAFEHTWHAIQVKSGHVNSGMIRDPKGTMEREKASMGVFITLEEPTREMKKGAATAGFYEPPLGRQYPKLQILTIQELSDGKGIDMPSTMARVDATFKKAVRCKAGPMMKAMEFDA